LYLEGLIPKLTITTTFETIELRSLIWKGQASFHGAILMTRVFCDRNQDN